MINTDKVKSMPGFVSSPKRKRIALGAAFGFFAFLILMPAPADIPVAAWHTAAVTALMAILWMSEAIPIPVTALLPLVLFPLFGIQDIKTGAAPYANPVIFLFLGGFLIALAVQKWNLHRRIALTVLVFFGSKHTLIIGGFMIACALLSMWVSNTATVMMMLPIAISVIDTLGVDEASPFPPALLLAIAYSCSIGGMGTLIGTPPNALLAAFMNESYQMEIGFLQWMMVGIPLVILSLPLAYFVLTRLLFHLDSPESGSPEKLLCQQRKKLGCMSIAEKRVSLVFLLVAALWITRPLLQTVVPGLSDSGIALFGAMLLFVLPAGKDLNGTLLDWHTAEKCPWGVLILFGGGLSLASAIQNSGLAAYLGTLLSGVENVPALMMVVFATAVMIFLTELTSNTATAATFLPILAAVAIGIAQNPLLLMLPAALAASCAFMLPVATPPNAIVYASRRLSMTEMARAGFFMNLLFIVLITTITFSLAL